MFLDAGSQTIEEVVAGEVVMDRGDGDHPPLQGAGVRIVLLLRGKLGLAGKPVVDVFARIDPFIVALRQARPGPCLATTTPRISDSGTAGTFTFSATFGSGFSRMKAAIFRAKRAAAE